MKPEDAVALGLFALAMGLVIYFSMRSSSTFKRRGNPPLVETREVGTGAEDASGRLSPLILYPPLTIALIVISVAISLMSNMGSSLPDLKTLLIADPESHGLLEIGAGEVWRLITPIFIHFGPIHLLFNMMWLWDLGKLIEVKKGHWFIAGFVLATGISSNLAQYLVTGSPLFGGMSGVVYGLLGYIWIQGLRDLGFGYVLHKQTVIMMLGWFILCWTGILGPIANWAHTAGLAIGIAWGYVESGLSKFE